MCGAPYQSRDWETRLGLGGMQGGVHSASTNVSPTKFERRFFNLNISILHGDGEDLSKGAQKDI